MKKKKPNTFVLFIFCKVYAQLVSKDIPAAQISEVLSLCNMYCPSKYCDGHILCPFFSATCCRHILINDYLCYVCMQCLVHSAGWGWAGDGGELVLD